MDDSGNYTDDSIERVAKATDTTKILRQKLNPKFIYNENEVHKQPLGHKKVSWNEQVAHGVKDILVRHLLLFWRGGGYLPNK